LDSLESRVPAQRRPDNQDGRSRRIHLTHDGVSLLAALQRRFESLQKKLAHQLGQRGKKQLMAALQTIIDLPR
jgi:DNA-binding MarR family transcriptional regulator